MPASEPPITPLRTVVPVPELKRLLSPTATTAERLSGLLQLGVQSAELAAAIGVSASGLRNWTAGHAEPRVGAAITLDDLRAAAKVLLDGGLPPERAAKWLTSRDEHRPSDGRPVDNISKLPTQVLTAAHREVLERRLAVAG